MRIVIALATVGADPGSSNHLSVRQAAFIRVGAMVGAGIFALLGAAGEVAAGAVLITFVFTTLIHEPASIVTLLVIIALSVGLDYGWKRSSPHHPLEVP